MGDETKPLTAEEQVPLWDAVNEYAAACDGDTGTRTVSDRRIDAVVAVNKAVVAIVAARLRDTQAALEREKAAYADTRDERDALQAIITDEHREAFIAALGVKDGDAFPRGFAAILRVWSEGRDALKHELRAERAAHETTRATLHEMQDGAVLRDTQAALEREKAVCRQPECGEPQPCSWHACPLCHGDPCTCGRPNVPDETKRLTAANLSDQWIAKFVAVVNGLPSPEAYQCVREEIARILDRVLAAERVAILQGLDKRCADALADEVDVLVRRRVIDSRSPAADALVDYRTPPTSPRSDRLVELEAAHADTRKALERAEDTLKFVRAARMRDLEAHAKIEADTQARLTTAERAREEAERERDGNRALYDGARRDWNSAVARAAEAEAERDAAIREHAPDCLYRIVDLSDETKALTAYLECRCFTSVARERIAAERDATQAVVAQMAEALRQLIEHVKRGAPGHIHDSGIEYTAICSWCIAVDAATAALASPNLSHLLAVQRAERDVVEAAREDHGECEGRRQAGLAAHPCKVCDTLNALTRLRASGAKGD